MCAFILADAVTVGGCAEADWPSPRGEQRDLHPSVRPRSQVCGECCLWSLGCLMSQLQAVCRPEMDLLRLLYMLLFSFSSSVVDQSCLDPQSTCCQDLDGAV